jgi:hypothetical protein
MSIGILASTCRPASNPGEAKAAIVLIAQKNALTKLAKGHQPDKTLVCHIDHP